MQKKGQIFSTDLIVGVLVFLLAIALFYFNVNSIFEEDETNPLKIEEKFIFNNLEATTNEYSRNHDEKISFFKNVVIDEEQLTTLALNFNGNFSFINDILIKNVVNLDLIFDACLYFQNYTGHIVPISNVTDNITGIGSDNMMIEENQAGVQIQCGSISNFGEAKPSCEDYLHLRKFTTPVLRDSVTKEGKKEIVKLTILVCAKEEA